jgi:hypothetical protein
MGRSTSNARRISKVLEYRLFSRHLLAFAIQKRGLFDISKENHWADIESK